MIHPNPYSVEPLETRYHLSAVTPALTAHEAHVAHVAYLQHQQHLRHARVVRRAQEALIVEEIRAAFGPDNVGSTDFKALTTSSSTSGVLGSNMTNGSSLFSTTPMGGGMSLFAGG
jgi:hypothetical protein